MHGDDELRAQLLRESLQRRSSSTANAVLEQIKPSMRQARRRRVATLTGAALTIVLGVGAVAQVVRTSFDTTIQTSSDGAAEISPATASSTSLDGDRSTAATLQPSDDPSDDSERPAGAVHESSTAEPVAAPATDDGTDDGAGGSGDDDPGDDQADDDGANSMPIAPPPSSSTIASATTSTMPPASTVTSAVPATSTTTPAPTTTQPAASQPERFTSKCGDATAIIGDTAVELVEVIPATGYDYTVEDSDHGAIAIQFTGSGEDCELKIRPSGDGHVDS